MNQKQVLIAIFFLLVGLNARSNNYPCTGTTTLDEGTRYEVDYRVSSTYKTATIEITGARLNGAPIARLNDATVTMQRTGIDPLPGEPKTMQRSGSTASYTYHGLNEGQEITFRLTIADGTQGNHTAGAAGIKHIVRQFCNGVEQDTEDDRDKPVGTCTGTVTLDQGVPYRFDYEIIGTTTAFTFNILQVRDASGAVIQNLSVAHFDTGVDVSNGNNYYGIQPMTIKGGTASITFTDMIPYQSLNFGIVLGTGPEGPGGVQGNLSRENRLIYSVGQGCGGSITQFDCRGTSRLNEGIQYDLEYYVRSNSTSVTIDILSIKYNGQICNDVPSLVIKPSFGEPKEIQRSGSGWSAYYGNQTPGDVVSFKFTVEACNGIGTHLPQFGIFHTIGQKCDGENPQPEEQQYICTGTTTLEEGQRYEVDYQIIKQGERLTVNLIEVRNESGVVQQQLKTANIKISYDEYTSMAIYGGKATKSWTSVKESNLSFALTLEADNSGQGQNAMGSAGFPYTLGATCGSQVIIPVSIDENKLSHMTNVYPSTTTGPLHLSAQTVISAVELYTLSGSLLEIWQPGSKEELIDISAIPKGLYILKISAENTKSVHKIIKK